MTLSSSLRSLLASLLLLSSGCSVFHRHRSAPAPVVETVRMPEPPTPATAARDLADAITSVLKLPADQTGRIRTVLNGTVEQVNAARQQYAAQSPELAGALKHINIASQTQLQKIMGSAKYHEFQLKQVQVQAEMQQK